MSDNSSGTQQKNEGCPPLPWSSSSLPPSNNGGRETTSSSPGGGGRGEQPDNGGGGTRAHNARKHHQRPRLWMPQQDAPSDEDGNQSSVMSDRRRPLLEEEDLAQQRSNQARPLSAARGSKASRSWHKLSMHVKNGEFLLYSTLLNEHAADLVISPTLSYMASTDENDDDNRSFEARQRNQRRREVRSAFRRNLNFSPTQCLVFILFLISIAVLSFSFLFHKWTIIDSIYFAVATFSTGTCREAVVAFWFRMALRTTDI